MRDVTVSKDVVVRADHGSFAVGRRAVDSDAFPNGVMIADLGSRNAAIPFQILSLKPNAGKGIDFVSYPQSCVTTNHHVREEPGPVTQQHVLSDHTIRPNFAIRPDFGFLV